MHFTVGVLTKELGGYYQALEPYDENPRPEYMEFKEVEEEELRNYQTRGVDKIRTKDGRLLNRWDNEFKVVVPGNKPFSDYNYDFKKLEKGERVTTIVPDDLQIVEVPYSEIYESFEEYMEEECYMSSRDEIKGVYGDWYNWNGKYDWFQLGGRWRGLLLVKKDVEHEVGEAGVFGDKLDEKPVPKGYKWVDSARIKDIEWEMMKKLNKERALKKWEEVEEALKEDGADSFTIRIRNGIGVSDTKESYVKRVTNFATYSILTEEHGWVEEENLGFVIEEISESFSWDDIYFDTFIKSTDENLFFSVVDCHV